jgi:hypothetical protein
VQAGFLLGYCLLQLFNGLWLPKQLIPYFGH